MGKQIDGEASPVMAKIFRTLDQLLLAAIVLVCWQAVSMKLGDNAVPPPLDTLRRLIELCRTSAFWGHALETGRAVLAAGFVATVGGALLGLAVGLNRFSTEVASPVLVAVYALPKVVLYPLILLLFGLSFSAKVALGVLNGFAPVAIVAMEAVRNINPSIVRTGKVFRLSPWQTIMHVLLPAALPEIFTGVRVGAALTIVGVLIGEIFASNRGLGFMLTNASQLNDNLTVMALTVFIVIAALVLNWLIGVVSPRQPSAAALRR
jgi:NitT/TauT family transport system permease protein